MNDNEAESVTYCYWHGNLCKQWCAGYKVTYATTNIYWQTWRPWNYIATRSGSCAERKSAKKDKTFKGDRQRSVPSVKIMAERDKTHVLEEAARGPGNF